MLKKIKQNVRFPYSCNLKSQRFLLVLVTKIKIMLIGTVIEKKRGGKKENTCIGVISLI